MSTYLLDANVLIALTVAEHEHHDRASAWAAAVDRFAVCPLVEGALTRFLVRLGESIGASTRVLQAVRALPAGEFWADNDAGPPRLTTIPYAGTEASVTALRWAAWTPASASSPWSFATSG